MKNILLWNLQILAALAFLIVGYSKLSGQAMMVTTFDQIGFGQWLRYVTGAIELGGALLLVLPKWALVAALLLAATMIGATLTHLLIIGGSPLIPIVLFCIVSAVAWGRRARLHHLLKYGYANKHKTRTASYRYR